MRIIKTALPTLILLSLVFALSSFSSSSEPKLDKEDLIGIWVYKSYKDGWQTFAKANDFKANKPGYEFKEDGTLVKRMDPDWCLRVKGPYANTDGTWEILEGNVLSITYKCYNSTSANTFELKNVTGKKFSYKVLSSSKVD